MPATPAQLADLRARVARLERGPASAEAGVLPFGLAPLDAALPGGGLRRGATHEVGEGGHAAHAHAHAHAAAATLFLAGIAARLAGPVLWVTPARDLFAPGLACAGLGPSRVIHAEASDARGVLALVEEGLSAPALAAVVGEVRGLSLAASRRLQLAAERSGVTGLLLMRWAQGWQEQPSAAVTRWRVGSAPSAPLACPGVGRARLSVELLRCRGAEAAHWILEAPDATGHCALPSDLAHRPLAPQQPTGLASVAA